MDNNNFYSPSYSSQPEVKYTPPVPRIGTDSATLEYQPIPGEKPRRKNGALKVIALLLCCVLLGSGAGAIYIATYDFGFRAGQQYEQTAAVPTAQVSAGTPQATVASESGILPAWEIYEQSVESCVGISVNIEYTGWFGQQSGTISGSGFIVSEDGYIVTNNHVIQDAYNSNLDVLVTAYDGTQYHAVIVGAEASVDIALLKIESEEKLKPLKFGTLDDMKIGEDVYAIGNPMTYLTFTFTEGILSAKDRAISTDTYSDDTINMFQMSAPINSGNSGGPVLNNRGEVIGIAAAKNTSTSDAEGLCFAVPIDDVISYIDKWKEKGYKPRAILGVTVTSINGKDRETNERVIGAGIITIEPDGPAEKAGLLVGDVITEIDGTEVESSDDLIKIFRNEYSAGDTAILTVYRRTDSGAKHVDITVTFGEQDPVVQPTTTPGLPEWFDLDE
ncbi:MAG: S1C family serine protease [Oscillospiraceae bacterium]|jgi:serine protease Do|nr:S1C family serine protease [Oscillospiraceae bacterium]